MEKEKKNMWAAAAFLLLSIVMMWAIPRQIQVSSILGTTSSVDSRWFPSLVSGLIGITALAELIASAGKYVRLKRQGGEPAEKTGRLNIGLVKAFAVFALFVLYAVLFKTVGFVISTLIVPPLTLLVCGGKNWRYYVAFYSVAAITYFLFVYVLKIALP